MSGNKFGTSEPQSRRARGQLRANPQNHTGKRPVNRKQGPISSKLIASFGAVNASAPPVNKNTDISIAEAEPPLIPKASAASKVELVVILAKRIHSTTILSIMGDGSVGRER